jgi:ABC-type uncharacterized transport system permease subunit
VQVAQLALHGRLVERWEQQALHRLRVAQGHQQFVDDALAFAPDVARVDHLVASGQQSFDRFDLLRLVSGRFQLPFRRYDRQRVERPGFELWIVILGRHLLEQVADAPAHQLIRPFDVAVA